MFFFTFATSLTEQLDASAFEHPAIATGTSVGILGQLVSSADLSAFVRCTFCSVVFKMVFNTSRLTSGSKNKKRENYETLYSLTHIQQI